MNTNQFTNPQTPVELLTYELAFAELEQIITAMESNNQSLENALALFERAQALAQRCSELLDQAELRVKQLTGEEISEFTPQESD